MNLGESRHNWDLNQKAKFFMKSFNLERAIKTQTWKLFLPYSMSTGVDSRCLTIDVSCQFVALHHRGYSHYRTWIPRICQKVSFCLQNFPCVQKKTSKPWLQFNSNIFIFNICNYFFSLNIWMTLGSLLNNTHEPRSSIEHLKILINTDIESHLFSLIAL